MNKISLILPFLPCSVNKAFAWYKIRHKSKDYKDFEKQMTHYFLTLWEKFEITGDNWLQFNYTLYMPLFYKNGNKKVIDIANYEKTLVDELCKNIKGFEDHKIKIIIWRKVESVKLETEIEILELI